MDAQRFHQWEPTGVTGYPITHPIVGQSDFYVKLRNWLPLVAEDKFAHVFAAVAPWGVGKSRLGYEIVAQVNATSKGWKVRNVEGELVDARLFDSEEGREQHLALYIRYSQVAHRQLNLDNWFAPAVYKALIPLASERLDTSIQHRIAKQGRDRLEAEGFDPAELRGAMELGRHEDDEIYSGTELATRLCNAAFEVLQRFGIRHVIVVLDELETAAERATGGMEAEEARTMDGKSITMLRKAVELLGRQDVEMFGKAVKEEDARARFPWLRFVALCSPAIGDELKEVESTDRRFEIVDLASNAFSDVSTFVRSLEADGRLVRPYPPGLVEAAYMMSGANFGWFNVLMAVVDQVLKPVGVDESPSLAWVFRRAIEIQERIGRHVLDHRALDEVELDGNLAGSEHEVREAAAELLFGQQPVPLDSFSAEEAERLLTARNVHGEALAMRYYRQEWSRQDCMQVLGKNRFERRSGTSRYKAPGIPESIDLDRLLDDLATLSVRDTEPVPSDRGAARKVRLLLPGSLPDFLQLVDLIHPHPAAEETARTLWMGLLGVTEMLGDDATHLGPSVEMLRRLDIRLRKASVGTVLRDPEENDAFTKADDRDQATAGERETRVLTGALRLLDKSWSYDPEPAGFDGAIAVRTPKSGLADFKELALHPKGHAVLAWAASDRALMAVAKAVAEDHKSRGRYPVLVLTSDYGLPEVFEKAREPEFQKARESVVVVHLNSGEESALRSVGLPTELWQGFRLRQEGFSTRFSERLHRIRTPIGKRVREWRHGISRCGEIAWPIRPNGALKQEALKRLVRAWEVVLFEHDGKPLSEVGEVDGFDDKDVLQEVEKLGLSPAAAPKGYTRDDAAWLWVGEGGEARPEVPPFLVRSVVLPLKSLSEGLSLDSVKPKWFWGYTWDGNRPSDVFRQWLTVAVDLGWARAEDGGKNKVRYVFVPREELEGKLAAAEGWLHDRYPATVKRLSEIVGPGATEQWFAPASGSKYQRALRRLQEASDDLDKLKSVERELFEPRPPEEARQWFLEATRLRLRAGRLIFQVFDRDRYAELPADLNGRTLHLLDESQDRPLWERIRQAEHFVDSVQRTARQIRRRVPDLRAEMLHRAQGIASFPINLFTRPLSTILHIVDDGLTGEDPKYSTGRAQQAKPDTLAHYLKDLNVAESMKSLRALAQEVGVGEKPSEDVTFDDVEGDVVSGFRNLVKRYADAREDLADLDARVTRLASALADAPADLSFPANVRLEDVKGRPGLIADQLGQSLEDDVEDLLNTHDASLQMGRFSSLMREALTVLLDAPERSAKGLEGKVRTLENVVTAYREELLEDPDLRLHLTALNVLRTVKGRPKAGLPERGDLEGRSLRDARDHLAGLKVAWAREGDELLDETGVSFAAWLEVVEQVRSERDPNLPPSQVEALLAAGFLRRTLTLGGRP